jgi:DNA-binding transcriptional regulator LsrR (DeoR family)
MREVLMEVQERNRRIYNLRKALGWAYRDIGPMFGISSQRAHQIVQNIEKNGIIDAMEEQKSNQHFDGPVSATEVSRLTGIPISTIVKWVSEGSVKIISDPGQTCPGRFVLLDHITLQERISRYRPKPRRNLVKAQ